MNKTLSAEIQPIDPSLVTKASQFCLENINHFKSKGLILHNFSFAGHLSNHIAELAKNCGMNEEEVLAPRLASFMLVLGYQDDYEHPWEQSIHYLKEFSKTADLSDELSDKVAYTLYSLNKEGDPISEEARLFFDAINSYTWMENSDAYISLLRTERQLKNGEIHEDLDWEELILRNMLDLRFFMEGSNKIYQESLSYRISQQNEKIQKLQRKFVKSADSRAFTGIEKRIPTSGIQTFFRTNYRNHINLSSIADNKANIMISVNAVLITLIISILSYKNLTEIQPGIFFPAVIFLFFGLASLTMAVLASRPKVSAGLDIENAKAGKSKKLVFFGNFTKLSEDEFEEALDNMFQDSNMLYANLSHDLYNLGKVLEKKYRLLAASFNLFLIGFAVTVLFFIIVLSTGILVA